MNVETAVKSVDKEMINSWADDLRGPVALHLRQKLLPVEGEDGVIFPPTYAMADERRYGPYAIDQLSDGTKVAQIDSVGSQANRMEPIFKRSPEGRPPNPFAKLVPQIEILVSEGQAVSLFDIGHRIGDALVRASALQQDVKKALSKFQKEGDATEIAKLAPTSLVFGAWDSRGDHAKFPRIVQSVIRAWDVEPLRRSAQYNPPVDYSSLEVFSEEEGQKAEGDTKNPLAQRGFVHVPAVDTHGGVVARGGVFRDVTVNLVALRQLDGQNGVALRRYILGLGLIAATDPQDGFLRQGCLLTLDPAAPANWTLVLRSGVRDTLSLAEGTVLSYAEAAAQEFKVGPDRLNEKFHKEAAKADLGEKKDKAAKKPKA